MVSRRGVASAIIASVIVLSIFVTMGLCISSRGTMLVVPKPYEVDVVLDPSISKVIGKDYAGFGVAYFTYGDVVLRRDISVLHVASVKKGKPVVISIAIPRNAVERMEKHARELSTLARKGYAVELPTISVTLFLYGPNDTEKICHAHLGAREWYLQHEPDIRKALTKVFEDPLAMIRKGAVFVVTSKNFVCGTVYGWQIDEALEKNLKKQGLEVSRDENGLLIVGKPSRERTSSNLSTLVSPRSCPLYKEEVFDWYLYNSRYTPPQNWFERLYDTDRNYASCLWYVFATRYSKRYYLNADHYSKDQALNFTARKLGIGLLSMQQVIVKLAQDCGGYVPTWYPTPVPNGPIYTFEMPWLGVAVYFFQDNVLDGHLALGGSLASAQFTYEYSGISLFGIPIYTSEFGTLEIYTNFIDQMKTGRAYLVAPTTLYYLGDGLVVHLRYRYVVDSEGCRWHVVWPEISFVPIYVISSVDWNGLHEIDLPYDQLPQHYTELLWSAHLELVYYGSVGTEEGIFYTDSSSVSYIGGGEGLAASIVSLFEPWYNKVLEGILSSLNNPIAREMIGFTISAIAFTQFYIEASGLAHIVKGRVSIATDNDYPVYIYKMVCPDVLAQKYSQIGYVPYAVEYRMIAGYGTAPPPGATNR